MAELATPDFSATVVRTQHAVAALLGGDPEPEKALWSRRDDITLANPAGGFRRGWHEVEAGLNLAASGFASGSSCTFEEITAEAGTNIAYIFELERFESELTNGQGVVTGALRVVMIFRLEYDDWKFVGTRDTPEPPSDPARDSWCIGRPTP